MMDALTFQGKHCVKFERVPIPKLRYETSVAATDTNTTADAFAASDDAGAVVVRVSLCGLCGSDLHPYNCREEGLDVGTVMGHELVGTVHEAGEGGRAVGGLAGGTHAAHSDTTAGGRAFPAGAFPADVPPPAPLLAGPAVRRCKVGDRVMWAPSPPTAAPASTAAAASPPGGRGACKWGVQVGAYVGGAVRPMYSPHSELAAYPAPPTLPAGATARSFWDGCRAGGGCRARRRSM